MIQMIISGGQTGADRAALDAAIQWQIPHGGWIHQGRLTESGLLSDKYQLKEMATDSYHVCEAQNIIDSNGTLIISNGPISGGSKNTLKMALNHNRPCLHIDLDENDAFDAAKLVNQWITKYNIETLNVAGSKAKEDPYIYQSTMHLITSVLHFDLIEAVMPEPHNATTCRPKTVDGAVDILISKLQLKDSIKIANMTESDLIYLHLTLGNYIRNAFGLCASNYPLIQSCEKIPGKAEFHEEDAPYVILSEVWRRLHDTHVMRDN
jgi:hypothetical protein